MVFDESHIPAHILPRAAGEEIRALDYGVFMYGAAWGHRKEVATPTLMADMFGFVSKEEMDELPVVSWELPVGAGESQ